MKMTMTTWIKATPERVYEIFADVARLPERIEAIKKIELIPPGPIAVGSQMKETRIMFGREATETFTITALEPGKLFAMTCNSCGVLYNFTHTFAAENGGTRVTLVMDGRTTTFMAWLMSPLGWLMKGMMQTEIQKDLEALKDHVNRLELAAVSP